MNTDIDVKEVQSELHNRFVHSCFLAMLSALLVRECEQHGLERVRGVFDATEKELKTAVASLEHGLNDEQIGEIFQLSFGALRTMLSQIECEVAMLPKPDSKS